MITRLHNAMHIVLKGNYAFIKIFTSAFFLIVLMNSCKKEEPGDKDNLPQSIETFSKMVTVINVQDSAALEYQSVLQTTGDSLEAFMAMANWFFARPEVKQVFLIDYHVIQVHFHNGLISPVSIIPVASDGTHLLRGGGSGRLVHNVFSKTQTGNHFIENDKMLIFIPYLSEFYPNGYPFLPKITGGNVDINPDLYVNEAADLSVINSFHEYGFIIIDTHGVPEGFSILTKIHQFDDPAVPGKVPLTEEQLISMMAQANNLPIDKIESGELQLEFKIFKPEGAAGLSIKTGTSVLVTDKYIRNMQHLDNAIVFGNSCYSGYSYTGPSGGFDSNLPEAWESIGAISYYGYAFANGKSDIAANSFCVRMEDSLITNLLYDLDSTGIAHLANNLVNQFQPGASHLTGGVSVPMPQYGYSLIMYNDDYPKIYEDFYFEHFLDDRYKYRSCHDSITDPRDGQVYPTICIGDKIWMAKNLNYAGAGMCYQNDAANCLNYGRLYSINELTGLDTSSANPSTIRGLCPQGWHVPSRAEWKELFIYAGYSAKKLCKPDDWPLPNTNTNELELSLVPGGQYLDIGDSLFIFDGIGETAHYWSSSATSDGQFYYSVLLDYNDFSDFVNYNDQASFQYYDFANERYMSCRCVKDE